MVNMIFASVTIIATSFTVLCSEPLVLLDVLRQGFVSPSKQSLRDNLVVKGEEGKMSLCFWIHPYRLLQRNNIFRLNSVSLEGPLISILLNNGQLGMTFSGCVLDFDFSPTLREWSHICISLSSEVKVLANGTLNEYECDTDFVLIYLTKNVHVVVGGFSPHSSFSGMLADIRVYWRELSEAQMRNISKVEVYPIQDDEIPSENMPLPGNYIENDSSKSPHESYVIIGSVSKEELLAPYDPNMILYLAETATYAQADSFCTKAGGQIPNITLQGDKALITMIHTFIMKTVTSITTFWLASDDERDCNAGHLTHNPLKLTETKEACNTTFVYLCIMEKKKPLKLIGVLDRLLEVYPVPYEIGVFESDKGYRLYLENEIFHIKNIFKDKTLFVSPMEKTSKLLGRSSWYVENKDTLQEISLSGCKENEFTCSDGRCIELNGTCNRVSDCHDKSDELRYCSIGLPPSEFYHPNEAPTSSKTPITLSLFFDILRILDIRTDLNMINIGVNFKIQWQDPRLLFKFLSQEEKKPVSEEFFKKFWLPEVNVKEADSDDEYKLHLNSGKVKMKAIAMGNGIPSIIGSYEVLLFSGDNVLLEGEKTEAIRILCHMKLFFYPFDRQNCSFGIYLSNLNGEYVIWNQNETPAINISSDIPLTLFADLSFVLDSFDAKKVKVSLQFERKYGAYIFNTFLPCIILESIGLMTHLLPIHDYNDRVTVTLSCLIIMATLFTKVSNSLPMSAEPKLIDIWMFFHVLVLMVVFIIHLIVIYIHEIHLNPRQKKKSTKESSRRIFYEEMKKCQSPKDKVQSLPTSAWLEEEDGTTKGQHWIRAEKANKRGFILIVVCYCTFLLFFGLISFKFMAI